MSEDKIVEWNARERALFEALSRNDPVPPTEADDLLRRLRAEGTFHRHRTWRVPVQIAAAIALLVIGGVIGARLNERHSLEGQLARSDMSVADRVLVLQRAGSAYVRAAQAYANAAGHADSTAVQVASQVLVGAANAIALHQLDGGMSNRLVAALTAAPAPVNKTNLIWY